MKLRRALFSHRIALESSYSEFRIQGESEGTCWIDSEGNEVETDVNADGGKILKRNGKHLYNLAFLTHSVFCS